MNKSDYSKITNFMLNHISLLILILFQVKSCLCGDCNSESQISDTSTCFNEIIKFSTWDRAGQITVRNDGILLVEFSNGGNRIFYGLNTNGRGYFTNEASIKTIYSLPKISAVGGDVDGRYESKNMLVSLSSDTSKSKQYVFSVSSFHSLTELHDIDSDNDEYSVWSTDDFFKFPNKTRYLFSHQFSLFEKGNNNIYYAAYVQFRDFNNKVPPEAYSVSYTLSKFSFTSLNNYSMEREEFEVNYDDRIVSAIYMEKYGAQIVVFFIKNGASAYYMRLHNVETLEYETNKEKQLYEIDNADDFYPGYGIFFKAIYLQDEYISFIFFTKKDDGKSLKFSILYLNNDFSFSYKQLLDINSFEFDTSIIMNEFYKINNERLLFVSTLGKETLVLMFFDTYDWYAHYKIRKYDFSLNGYKFNMEFSVGYYNNFLVLATTLEPSSGDIFFGTLFFFSYPNGTDFYMNISPYVMDSGYYHDQNLINYLISKRSMDNNIFGYTPIQEIKLISIPPEIIFYRSNNLGTPLSNNDWVGGDHVLNQDKNIIKYDRNYTLDYQYMARDQSNYNDMYYQSHSQWGDDN